MWMTRPMCAHVHVRSIALAIVVVVIATALPDAGFARSDESARSAPTERQHIDLHRNGEAANDVVVTVGIPFAPGQLDDAKRVRILDAAGREIAAHVDATLLWYSAKRSIRAVRAQFRARLTGAKTRFYFAFDAPRTMEASGWTYGDDLVDAAEGLKVPGILGTLSADWLTASLMAGPQQPSDPANAYDRYVDTQFAWATPLPTTMSSAWLFDRPSTLFKQYVRTGRIDYLRAAVLSYRFYMAHLTRSRSLLQRTCAGGWSFGDVKTCDAKYVYIEPILLAVGLTGDDSQHDAALVDSMIDVWQHHAWDTHMAYSRVDQAFTERHAGLGLLETVAAYELTGKAEYLDDINQRVSWLRDHQTKNPDLQAADGSWRHSWQMHEGETYAPDRDVRGASPWMSENIADALWHAWLATGNTDIPPMLVRFGQYLEKYGWIASDVLAQHAREWGLDACNGPHGQMSWYWSSSLATPEALIEMQTKNGKYSDQHNVELALPVALARYFERDPAEAKKLEDRLTLLAASYATTCAENAETPRRFNWNNRGAGTVQWLVRHFPEPGKAPDKPAEIASASY
jgi:hypothetical protein